MEEERLLWKCAAVCCSALQCFTHVCSRAWQCIAVCYTRETFTWKKWDNQEWIYHGYIIDPQTNPTSWKPVWAARPNWWFKFTAWSPDLRKLFYLLFSTNINYLSKDPILEHLILRTRLCSTGFISQHGWFVDFHLINVRRRKWVLPVRYKIRKGKHARLTLKMFYRSKSLPSQWEVGFRMVPKCDFQDQC